MKSLYLVVFLASCFAFLGCPTQPAPVQLDPVSQPVVVDEEIPAGMGEVVMEGNILEDKVLDDLNQVVDYLRPYVSQLEVTFYPADMGGVGKAGGGDFWT